MTYEYNYVVGVVCTNIPSAFEFNVAVVKPYRLQ